MKRYMDEQTVAALSRGAMYLGSGGGGDVKLTELMAKRAIRENGPVPLLSPFHVPDEAWVIPVAIMGSPTIFSEHLPSGSELKKVVETIENEKHIAASAITGLEIGGMNALTPVIAAALTNLPLLDADGMGRAFPELQMTTYHGFGVKASPAVIANRPSKTHLLLSDENTDIEKQARTLVTNLGGWAAIACYPMQGCQIRESGILQTYTLTIRLGEALSVAMDAQDVMEKMQQVFQKSIYGKPVKLLEGKIVDLQRNIIEGTLQGSLVVEGSGAYIGEYLSVFFHNEYLLVQKHNVTLVTVPDLICVLDEETGYPLSVEELENNGKVWVIAIPSPFLLQTTRMLDVVGPMQFGIAEPFIPMEERIKTNNNEG
ncbi:DUF917 domain-containing protein [Geobacillus subterraneus]|uniref:DUF917 domain-containing protein n=1 Tax=Geobacillus subterraneus TaxID=129338 RepID=UPI0016192B0F